MKPPWAAEEHSVPSAACPHFKPADSDLVFLTGRHYKTRTNSLLTKISPVNLQSIIVLARKARVEHKHNCS